jgi:ATP-binding cassette, subfamily B, bacterial
LHIPLRAYWSLLITYLKPQRRRVILLAALLCGSIGLQLANPQVVRYFIDTAMRSPLGAAQRALVGAALLFIAVALVQRVVAFAAVYVGQNVGWIATNALRADLTHHCLRLDMSFHKQRTPGELIERIDGDVTVLANFFSQLVVQVLGNALLVLGILALLFRVDYRVGLGLTLYAAVTFLALGAIQHISVARWAESRQASAEGFGYLEERITGAEDIRANGAEAYVLARLAPLTRAMLEKKRSAELLSNLTFVTSNFLFVTGYALGLGVGAYLYTQHQITIGTAYLIVFYIGMVSGPLENIRKQAQDLQRATASIARVRELFRITPEVLEAPRAPLPASNLAVEFQGVSFSYDEGDSVLRDVSFQLESGQVLGLLGRTGSGKTTLSRLLFRLYDPTAGAVRLGGVDLRDVALADLRWRVGMVTQEVQLFRASVRDNLTFFDRRIPDAQIERVLADLGLGAWYQALPGGLDTPLAAGGQGLSAGEAQLLVFARVFLNDPGLVILDEASSRLDPATEHLLEHAVDRLLADRTAIVIAHRLRTVGRADAIAILEEGRIIEYGPRGRLATDPTSRFSRLLEAGLEEALA